MRCLHFHHTRPHAPPFPDALSVSTRPAVHITLGQTKGNTMLPLPEGAMDKGPSDKDKIHILESAIVTWTKQIKAVLKGDPDSALKIKGNYPGPLIELDFWKERAANLNAIEDQLASPKIQKIVAVLEEAKSTYYGSYQRLHKVQSTERQYGRPAPLLARVSVGFTWPLHPSHHLCILPPSQSSLTLPQPLPLTPAAPCPSTLSLTPAPCRCALLQEVEAGRAEANDNVKFLKPMRRYLDKLNMMDDLPALVDIFKPIFHLLILVWKHSTYYNTAPRVVTFLREACNDLIYQVRPAAPVVSCSFA